MNRTRVLVADDHAVVRAGVRALLEAQPDIVVVGEASCGAEVLAALGGHPVDVVLLDITMPDTIATSCIEAILRSSPTTRVLVLTMHSDPLYLRSVLAAGALGYVTKSTAPTELIAAIRAVREGRRFIAAALAPSASAAPAAGPPEVQLSPREREVLALLVRGHTYQEIADALQVSINSVGTYRSRIAVKLGIESRAELVRVAHQLGLPD